MVSTFYGSIQLAQGRNKMEVHLYPANSFDAGFIRIVFKGEHRMRHDLTLDNLGDLLLVLREERTHLNKEVKTEFEGNIYSLDCEHIFTPGSSYRLTSTCTHGKETRKLTFDLTDAQACGLEAAISSSMTFVAFGVPG